MKKLTPIVFVLLLAILTNCKDSNTVEETACTQEALICPDGSSVGRTGPNCEFADCPEVTNCETDADCAAENKLCFESVDSEGNSDPDAPKICGVAIL